MKFINRIPNTDTWVIWNAEDIPNWSNKKGFLITIIIVVSIIGGIWIVGGLFWLLGWLLG